MYCVDVWHIFLQSDFKEKKINEIFPRNYCQPSCQPKTSCQASNHLTHYQHRSSLC